MKVKIVSCAMLLCLAVTASGTPAQFKVIVNGSVQGQAISKESLSMIFLGRTVRWGDHSTITPVDLSVASPLRASFSENVLGMPVFAVQNHWMRQMTGAGLRPPVTKASDSEVIELVASRPGAIGYVSQDASLPPTVRVLALQ